MDVVPGTFTATRRFLILKSWKVEGGFSPCSVEGYPPGNESPVPEYVLAGNILSIS